MALRSKQVVYISYNTQKIHSLEHEAKLGCILGYKKWRQQPQSSSPIVAPPSKCLWLVYTIHTLAMSQGIQTSCVHNRDAITGRWSLP